jgi:DNA repair photolyase
VVIITKSHLVARDADLLAQLAAYQAAAVFVSVTSLDGQLARVLEPRASQPAGRLAAIETLAGAGVPAGVLVAPIIPALTDHELPAIISEAGRRGAQYAGYTLLRLPFAVAPLFEQWLQQHFPDRKDRVLNRLRELRGGKLNDPRFGSRMKGEGPLAEAIHNLFALGCRTAGIGGRTPPLSTGAFRRPGEQRLLFE